MTGLPALRPSPPARSRSTPHTETPSIEPPGRVPTATQASEASRAPGHADRWRMPRHRLVMLAGAGIALMVGTYTGLGRAGAYHRFAPADAHGIVMVLGFLGTLIALERAVAATWRWAYVAPVLSAVSVLWLLTPLPRVGAGLLLSAAGAIVTVVYLRMLRMRYETHLAVMALGAMAWLVAALLWTTGTGPIRLTPMLAAFLVLTIVGERLELSRLSMPGPTSRRRFLVALGVFVVGVAISVVFRGPGLIVAGSGILAQVVWLARYDVARRTVRRPGLPRFAAVCILGGYGWLAVSGIFWLAIGAGASGFLLHDALVHALFLGFVLSMVMGHAPIIAPAILRTPLIFRRVAYLPLVLLHLSVALRIGADVAGSLWWRELALHGNVAALTTFIVVVVTGVRAGRRQLAAR